MNAIRSMWAYSLYLAVIGLSLVFVPHILLSIFGFPATEEVWIRVMGVLLLILAYFDAMAARSRNVAFMRWSVPARAFAALCFVFFVAMGWAQPMLLAFGAVDIAAAVWTWVGLRRDTA